MGLDIFRDIGTYSGQREYIHSYIQNPRIFRKLRCLTPAQPSFTCSKLTIETLEQGVKYVQSLYC